MTLLERLDAVAGESTAAWNNAGTGHSALCELNYTPQRIDGTIDITKAVVVNEQYQISRQFWANAVESGVLGDPRRFINAVPHVSFVHGVDNVDYLRKRHEALARHTLFAGMEFVDDASEFARRLPLMAKHRDFVEPVALTWSDSGTDVDFGELTTQLIGHLGVSGADVRFGSEVCDIKRDSDGAWRVTAENLRTGRRSVVKAKFVFVGAGGGALPLLQKAGIKEINGFGGFPASGAFLRCVNPALVPRHHAKVYGKPTVGAPPMSVPHLDTRIFKGDPALLFGPYAGWTPKFLRDGKNTDLFKSIRPGNLGSLIGVGLKEMPLAMYLLKELLKTKSAQVQSLAEFVPTAEAPDWELVVAGQRVQIIRPKGRSGVLEFGTAVISAADGSISGLVGASPGASTAATAMVDVLRDCFPKDYPGWEATLTEMIPSLGCALSGNPGMFAEVWDWTSRVLQLADVPIDRSLDRQHQRTVS